ncbi:MAG: ABC transporter ATP-binding protein [Acidobacteriota bacterium]
MGRLRIFRRILSYYREKPSATILGAASVVASALIALQAPGLVRRAVDGLAGGAPLGSIFRYAILILAVTAGSGLFLFTQRRLLVGVSRHIEHRLRTDLYAHLLRLPPAFYMRERVGDLLTRATSDVGAVRMAVGPALMYAINTVTVMIVATTFMLAIDPTLTGLALLAVPLVAGATRAFGGVIHSRWGQTQDALSRYTTRLQEHLVGLRVLRAYTCEATEIAEMATRSRDYVERSARLIRVSALFQPSLQFLIGLSFVTVLGVGGNAVRTGSMTLGQFVEFNLYLVRMIWPMIAVGWVANLVQRGAASMSRIEELFGQPPLDEPAAAPEPSRPHEGPASLELRRLSFTFPSSSEPALREVSLQVGPGQRLAIVGEIASGKSTLLSLIPRLLEPDRGTVFVDGVDILDFRLGDLRGRVALVPQGSFLFSATLRDNIALANPEASEGEVVQAAVDAGLRPDLERLPNGVETVVGERGVTLSGGQRQRVAIARALITRPGLLLLDDCLSAVDTETERAVLSALPRTTLVIATHRLAAAELCDRVVVLEGGAIAEIGAPGELAARGGIYARLLALQNLAGLGSSSEPRRK